MPYRCTRVSPYVQWGAAFLSANFSRYALGGCLEETPFQLQRGPGTGLSLAEESDDRQACHQKVS